MISNGAIDEVKKLLSLDLDPSLPIMKAHGVPEISQYLSGSINLQECILKGQQVTRNYVKRQITWWKSSKFYNVSIYDYFPSNMDLESLDLLVNNASVFYPNSLENSTPDHWDYIINIKLRHLVYE